MKFPDDLFAALFLCADKDRPYGLLRASAAGACDTAYCKSEARPAALQRALQHLAHGLRAYRAVASERIFAYVEPEIFYLVGVAYERAVKNVAHARDRAEFCGD